MIKIIIKHTLNKSDAKIEAKKEALNVGVHEAGFMLEKAIIKDIASYPSVDGGKPGVDEKSGGRFLGSVQTDINVPFQAIVYTNLSYAIFLERGTSPHFIKPSVKKALRWKKGNEWFFSKGHMVSGIKPRRHFERTSINMKPEIFAYIESKLKAVE